MHLKYMQAVVFERSHILKITGIELYKKHKCEAVVVAGQHSKHHEVTAIFNNY